MADRCEKDGHFSMLPGGELFNKTVKNTYRNIVMMMSE